jgi:hypothetical protein
MSGTPLWRRYLRFWGPDPGSDVDDEFTFHVETRIDELVAQGVSPKDARNEALRGFGNIQAVKQICRTLAEERERAMRRTQWWSDWRYDLRSALRHSQDEDPDHCPPQHAALHPLFTYLPTCILGSHTKDS